MTISNDTFLRACRQEPVLQLPVWYMRQAGRYDADYRKIREKYSLVEICEHPEICCQVTCMPVEKLGVDAAILFSDIMIPVGAMGLHFEIRENIGPVIQQPIRTSADVERLQAADVINRLPHVFETIKMLTKKLHVPLIGFTGAPFTLASYMIEGGPSREYLQTKRLMVSQPILWKQLMDKLAQMILAYGKAQVAAGASAIQLFDSWVGALAPADFSEYIFPTMKYIFQELLSLNVPIIYFGVTTGELLSEFANAGASVVGVDWRVPIQQARLRIGPHVAVQGNLDPAMLYAPWPELERRVRAIIDEGIKQPGFIFNLGHGVKPTVELNTLQKLTQFVHAYSSERLHMQQK